MAPKKNKKRKTLKRTPCDGGDVSSGISTMNSDPFHPDFAADPRDGTAAIHPVTPEMMDEAAHRVAELADGVAHHETAMAEGAAPSSNETVEAMREETSDATTTAVQLGDAIRETAQEALTQAHEGTVAGLDPAEPAVEEVYGAAMQANGDVLPHVGEGVATAEAEAGLSAAADTLGRYNATLVEMVRANMAATTNLFAALIQAKSVPEAVAINADHLRRQFDALTTQGRELATLAQRLTFDALKPFGGIAGRDR